MKLPSANVGDRFVFEIVRQGQRDPGDLFITRSGDELYVAIEDRRVRHDTITRLVLVPPDEVEIVDKPKPKWWAVRSNTPSGEYIELYIEAEKPNIRHFGTLYRMPHWDSNRHIQAIPDNRTMVEIPNPECLLPRNIYGE